MRRPQKLREDALVVKKEATLDSQVGEEESKPNYSGCLRKVIFNFEEYNKKQEQLFRIKMKTNVLNNSIAGKFQQTYSGGPQPIEVIPWLFRL